MEHDSSEHRGQQQVGRVDITVMLTSLSLAWIWSIDIPSGRGSRGLLSIRTSFLCQHRFTRSCESAVYHPCFSPSNPIYSPLHQSRPRAYLSQAHKQMSVIAFYHQEKTTRAALYTRYIYTSPFYRL